MKASQQQLLIDLEPESEDDERYIISHLLGKVKRMNIYEKERVMESLSYPVKFLIVCSKSRLD